MKILLDHNVPAQLKRLIEDHAVYTARELRWDLLVNGDLLRAAESAGFTMMITGDQNLTYQQNNLERNLSLIVITQTKRRLVTSHHAKIRDAISRASPGSYELVVVPHEPLGIRAVD